MGPEGSVPYTQQPATDPCQSSQTCTLPPYFFKIHFDIIVSSISHLCSCSCSPHLIFIILKVIRKEYKQWIYLFCSFLQSPITVQPQYYKNITFVGGGMLVLMDTRNIQKKWLKYVIKVCPQNLNYI
jgi:hypothetical protein